jgi:arsenical resistance protein ArsH
LDSRFLTFEAAHLLEAFGADTRIFEPCGLPLPDDAPEGRPKDEELRGLSAWSERRSGARQSGTERCPE